MNLGITPTTTTTATKTNETLTTALATSVVNTTTASDIPRKDTIANTPTTKTQSSCSSLNSNHNLPNIINPSKSYTTVQNCFEILTSIQNNTLAADCMCAEDSTSTNSFKNSTIVCPSLVASSESSSNTEVATSEKFAGDQSMKLLSPEELIKRNNSTFSNIDCTRKSSLSSIPNSLSDTASTSKSIEYLTTETDLNQSSESDKGQAGETGCHNIVDNFELQDKINYLTLDESKVSINLANLLSNDEDSSNKSNESSAELLRSVYSTDCIDKIKNASRLSERAKKKSWYNVLYPNYKSRSQEFRKLFKDVPIDERLIVDYSCALYRDLLIQGRLYISQNYVCFHANILGWETCLSIKYRDVTSISKEKTALVIPNAISICTPKEKFFFSSFTTRDKTFLILFRVWQNTLMNKPMPAQEIWQLVHNYYGDELGLTTDDEDYIDPTVDDREDSASNLEFVTAIDDSNSLSVFEETVESSSGSSASNSNSGNNSGDYTKSKTMKTNAKPEDGLSSNPQPEPTPAVVADSENACSSAILKEPKQNVSSFDSKRKVSKISRQREESTNKNSETLPTDISDSSDSEETNIPFVATAECDSLHEGRQLVHTILPINIDALFNMLFSKSKFFKDFHAMRKSSDLIFSDWTTNEDGQKTRTFNVTVQLAASVGPKTSKVTEFQVMRDCSKPGELYAIDINNVNSGIPYADSFSVLSHYCLVKTVDDHTMLSVHSQIKYKKSVWGVVKGFIEKNAWAGLDDFYTSLLHCLQSETCIPPAKGKGRRPRRGKHKQSNALCLIAPPLSEDVGQTITSLESHVEEHEYLSDCFKKIGSCIYSFDIKIHHQNSHRHHHNHHHQQHRHCYCREHMLENDTGIKGPAAQIRPPEELPILFTKSEPTELCGIAQTLTIRHPIDNPVIVAEATTKFRWLSLFVLVLLCFLIFVNVILLHKLWKLEERIEEDMSTRARIPNLAALKQLPNNHEDWIELLRRQEVLHETEFKKWHTVLQTAIALLKKVSVVCQNILENDKITDKINQISDEF